MMKTWLATLALAMTAMSESRVEAHHHTPAEFSAMVNTWYIRYLHRPVDEQGIRSWVEVLMRGEPPLAVEARIIGSSEYFCNRAGGCPRRWVSTVYFDIVGEPACPRTMERWLGRLDSCKSRDEAAKELLLVVLSGQDPRGTATPPKIVYVPVYQPPVVLHPCHHHSPHNHHSHTRKIFGIKIKLGH